MILYIMTVLPKKSYYQPTHKPKRMNPILIILTILLFIATSISLAQMALWPVQYGIGAGLIASVILLALWRLLNTDIKRVIEIMSLCVLLITSVIISWQALAPLLGHQTIRIQESIPVLLTTVAIYILYLLLNRHDIYSRPISVADKLAALFSGPPITLTFVMAITITTYILIAIQYVGLNNPDLQILAIKFLDRGIIPPLTVFLFCWGLLMITNKTYILWSEHSWLNKKANKDKSVLMQTYYQTLQDTGNVAADTYLDLVWKKSADFYIIPRYINWAIPILGFIGTVLGISLAADGIQRIINTQQNIGQLSSELGQAIAPLGIAFDTTLIALSLSVFLMLLQTILHKWEDNLLMDYEAQIRNMPLNNL